MEIEVLDLSQKPICLNETDLSTAMDLSQKMHPQSSGEICLSEDDDESINQLLNKLNIENPCAKTVEACQLLLHQLNEKLRNEETMEILLSQMKYTQTKLSPLTTSTSITTGIQNGHSTPLPVISTTNTINSTVNHGSLNRNAGVENGLVSSPGHQTDGIIVTANRTFAHVTSASGSSSVTKTESNKTSQSNAGLASINSGPRMTKEMAMQALDQQYLARKALLRKQADKALSEVPLARQPQGALTQPDLNFIPSINTNEFVALVGLEEVVKNLQEYRNAALGYSTNEVHMVFTPFNCVQCGTDFTPLWKRERPGSSKVVCESCCGENYHRALQSDYQEKIRLVLKKYQDQERDLDRDYKDMLDSPKKFELFRKEQEKKLLAMNTTVTRPSTTTQPASRTSLSSGNHHSAATNTVGATPTHGRSSHRPCNTVPALNSTTVSQQYGQQMRHQNTAPTGISAAPSAAQSQLTADQLVYMQMFQALNQLGSTSSVNQQTSRQQQQLMQQILQMAYMSSASTLLSGSPSTAAANSFVQFLGNMTGLLSSPAGTPDAAGVGSNSTTNNALLNYYLSMLQQQQQQAAANSDS